MLFELREISINQAKFSQKNMEIILLIFANLDAHITVPLTYLNSADLREWKV